MRKLHIKITLVAGLACALLQGCSGVTTANTAIPNIAAAPAAKTAVVDPACLETVGWFNDPREGDIRINGCRAPAALPARGADGWREYSNADGALIKVRGETVDQATGAVSFEVLYNGGGSLTVLNRVSGIPMGGVLKVGTYTVKSLN